MKKLFLVLVGVMAVPAFSRAQQTAADKPAVGNPAENCVNLPTLERRLEALNDRLKDWAELSRYRESNKNVDPPAKDEQRVVFLGDSITDGWGNPKFGAFFPGRPYMNRGIGGQTTPQMLVRFRPDVIALQPWVLVILAGTNDIAGNTGPMTLEETEGNLASMAELARAHGIRVVLSSVMPVSDFTAADGKRITQTEQRPPSKILALNDWIKKYAAENGHIYLDYFSAMADERGFLKTELTFDGLHPNAQGYAVMAPLAEKAIKEAMSKQI